MTLEPPADDAMHALLRAGRIVRGGFYHWLKGAPTHVLAELLTALEEDGWRLVPVAEGDELDDETFAAEHEARARWFTFEATVRVKAETESDARDAIASDVIYADGTDGPDWGPFVSVGRLTEPNQE